MSGTDKARLCAVCERHVYDLSAMSSNEAEKLLACDDERICVRLTRGPDGQIITADRPARFKQLPWFSAIPAATLAAFLSVIARQDVYAATPHGSGGLRGKLSIAVTNDVADDAEVVARNVSTGQEFRTTARKDGSYRLPLPKGRYTVDYTERGFRTCRLDGFRAGWLPMRVDVAFGIPPIGEYTSLPPCSTYDPRNFFVRMTTAPFKALRRLFRREDS
jgi:hypothetical protein